MLMLVRKGQIHLILPALKIKCFKSFEKKDHFSAKPHLQKTQLQF